MLVVDRQADGQVAAGGAAVAAGGYRRCRRLLQRAAPLLLQVELSGRGQSIVESLAGDVGGEAAAAGSRCWQVLGQGGCCGVRADTNLVPVLPGWRWGWVGVGGVGSAAKASAAAPVAAAAAAAAAVAALTSIKSRAQSSTAARGSTSPADLRRLSAPACARGGMGADPQADLSSHIHPRCLHQAIEEAQLAPPPRYCFSVRCASSTICR